MGMQIALGTRTNTILFLLLCLPFLSITVDIYRPVDLFRISCGSSSNSSSIDGPNWTGDNNLNLFSESQEAPKSVAAPPLTRTTIPGPYNSARLSRSQFTYSFTVTPGPKFLRLFFYSTSYQNFDRPDALFSVKSDQYTLLQDFNASLNADADEDPADTMFREYCIHVEDGQRLFNLTFIPSTPDSYAFINGIEVVSMPAYLYYTSPDDNSGLQLVGLTTRFRVENNSVLETEYRLNVGGRTIPPSSDTGMLRTWDADDKYLTTQSGPSVDYGRRLNLSFTTEVPEYTAPDEVYRTLRNMGTNASFNMRFNMTWELPVDSGFTYLLRLHFCELNPMTYLIGDRQFYIFITDQMAENLADVLMWTNKKKGVPVVRDYAVFIPTNQKKVNLSLKLHPRANTAFSDALLNAIELFKINNSQGSLAGPNPDPPLPQTPSLTLGSAKKKSSDVTLAAVTGGFTGLVLFCLVVAFFLIKRRKKGAQPLPQKYGSSFQPINLCRHFSIEEIRAATNKFDEQLEIGVGGFGNVYKGYINDGPSLLPVAIKRLKPGSQQGAHEFMNEIEMLSQLRHIHLVSLIGYCYESNEMILVYDFMARGTLSDHLYDTEDDSSLPWKQRVQICLGAARGLHYLHTGAKHMIIHRDVKSTNILLDEKWVAKVSDFGLSRIGPTGISMTHRSTVVKGSFGYLDPEYYKRQRLTEKSDVYSFGVVLLEVLCARQPLLPEAEKKQVSLVDWARRCYQMGTLAEIVDPALKGQIAPPECLSKFAEIAFNCLLDDGAQRPSMNDVVGALEFVLKLQEDVTATKGMDMVESDGNYEDSDEMFSSTQTSRHASDYSKSTGITITSNGDHSCRSKETDRLISENVFPEIN